MISLSGDPVSVSSNRQIGEQVIAIPASRFGTKSLWVITVQRQGSLETYGDDVVLSAVSLSYSTQPLTREVFMPVLLK